MLTCKNCRFCEPINKESGYCHRAPPTFERINAEQVNGSFPPVSLARFWCGELRLRLWPRWLKFW